MQATALAVLLGASPGTCAGEVQAASPAPSPSPESATMPMCREHGVLDAVCTKCNPKLAAIFKAKGDWCGEHGFPESFCPTCKPDRGGRPDADLSGADTVRLATPQTADIIGIQTVQPAARTSAPVVTAQARVELDATRMYPINARSAGVVRRIHVDVGTAVTAGQPLITIESAGVSGDRSRLNAASAKLRLARSEMARQQRLARIGVAARKDVQTAESAVAEAEAEVQALTASLAVVGGEAPGSTYTLDAPAAGTVFRRVVTAGLHVDPSQAEPLLTIVDTSKVWAELDVHEADVARVRTGQLVTIALDAVPDRMFTGRISYISPEVDPKTRTITARVVLDNPDGQLRANMFGTARIAVDRARAVLEVPRTALQRIRDGWVVFVRTAPERFEPKTVSVERADQDPVAILAGLDAAANVVTTGSFLMKTEVLKSSIGAGCTDD